MLYQTYQAQADFLAPFRAGARAARAAMGFVNGEASHALLRRARASFELLDRFALTHERPDYRIPSVLAGNAEAPITEEVVARTPFGALLHFHKETSGKSGAPQPKVLIVAPLSGHFATLLRETVRTMLPDHDVYITDWTNARDVPPSAGRFGFSDYIDHVIKFLEFLGPGAHALAVCQPCVQVLAATAIMSAQKHPCTPRSMTLMGGPIDARVNPSLVNALAFDHDVDWFAQNLIATVPMRYAGAGRRVYPGFVQLSAFMNMNMARHKQAHRTLYHHLADNELEKAQAIKDFYDEYFAVLDLTAEFYLETVAWVFQEARLAKGELTHRGARVDCGAIKRTALLTVEGERDDVCSLGQTQAAHELCTSLRPYLKRHHMQTGVGHYGVFSGRRWQTQIYPIVRNHIETME
ncbi:MAG: polyhydroxyalkanoate depolymerase [Hyphomonadaceae bacterium]|nr:polyhydroxyalkanoate depolymerase [Hyphomonadaceae bacterium]